MKRTGWIKIYSILVQQWGVRKKKVGFNLCVNHERLFDLYESSVSSTVSTKDLPCVFPFCLQASHGTCVSNVPNHSEMFDRFERKLSPLWYKITGGQVGNGCGILSDGKSLYFSGPGKREARTFPVDTTNIRSVVDSASQKRTWYGMALLCHYLGWVCVKKIQILFVGMRIWMKCFVHKFGAFCLSNRAFYIIICTTWNQRERL